MGLGIASVVGLLFASTRALLLTCLLSLMSLLIFMTVSGRSFNSASCDPDIDI